MKIIDIARDAFGGMVSAPKALIPALNFCSEFDPSIESKFLKELKSSLASDEIFGLVNKTLSSWDYEAFATWIDGTEKNTEERRQKIYSLLKIEQKLIQLLDAKFPPNLSYEAPIVIATEHEAWYDVSRQKKNSFYRDAYSKYLREHNNWKENQILELEESTRLVTERLSDPERDHIHQVKGLVVGYVQSGKTANFTGVVARAADAGYRLIIILAGTLNILRAQTQRRIDRELIGRPFVDDEETYAIDLKNFVDHGGVPSERGEFDWHRLTNIDGDYKRLKQGIQSLEFRKRNKTKPFNHPDNLHLEDARILVVKKLPSVLKKVAADLKAIKSRLADIPTLVIDDESDQASVNTKEPTIAEIKERTQTNMAIISLLQQLPRAQYVGYTATPFANVLIDPNTIEDLFPRDFIISLSRPSNYMGVADFHDLENPNPSIPGANETAFVRDVLGDDDSPENLQKALDSYILSGAIKLYRQKIQPDLKSKFRHHTMLIHSSSRTNNHDTMAIAVLNALGNGGYLTGTAWKRLEALWIADFSKVSLSRAGSFPVPSSFSEIKPFLGPCWKLLTKGEKPVLIVNGDAKDNPDFESDNIWKIIVGGAKLSRGYTIEGLTISYYRRRATAADALMQMGRWFGFRDGYRDLVRLYIGRKEPAGINKTIDLYKAFEGVCRDEIEFRSELKKYAYPPNGKPLLPIQIPPLVPSHLLRPTAKNKMYNAFITFKNASAAWKEPTRAPLVEKKIVANQVLLGKLLTTPLTKGILSINTGQPAKQRDFSAQWTILAPKEVLDFLDCYHWLDGDQSILKREREFLSSRENTFVDQWLFICIDGPKESEICTEIPGQIFHPFNRSRIDDRFNAYSEPDHRKLAEFLCNLGDATSTDKQTLSLQSKRQGIFVFYPTRDKGDLTAKITPGFALQFPANDIKTPISFSVHVKTNPNAIVVDELVSKKK